MTIENAERFVAALWDWSCLDGCWARSTIKPNDIDAEAAEMDSRAEVENNGYFLRIETKGIGVPLKQGQRILLEALARMQNYTVFVVWGIPGKPAEIQTLSARGWSDRTPCDLSRFRWFCERWTDYAQKAQRPFWFDPRWDDKPGTAEWWADYERGYLKFWGKPAPWVAPRAEIKGASPSPRGI